MLAFIRRLSIKQKILGGMTMVIVLLVIVTITVLISLNLIKTQVNQIVTKIQPTVISSLTLADQLDKTASSIAYYLLSKEPIHKKAYLEGIETINLQLRRLRNMQNIQENHLYKQTVNELSRKIKKFNTFKKNLIGLAENGLLNVPARQYAIDTLNPNMINSLQLLQEMISSESEETITAERKPLLLDIQSLRYDYLRMVSEYRVFLAFRDASNLKNYNSYIQLINEDIVQVNSHKELHTFEEENAIEQFEKNFTEFKKSFQQIVALSESDKWRNDSYLIRTEIGPLLSKIQIILQDMVNKQRKQSFDQTQTIEKNMQIIWYTVAFLLIISFISGVIIITLTNTQVVTPIIHLRNILKDISKESGQLNKRANVNSTDEIGQLALAFNEMIEVIQSNIQREDTEKSREHDEKEILSNELTAIERAVDLAAKGDLTADLTARFSESHITSSVTQLAKGINTMIVNLNDLITDVQSSAIHVNTSATEISTTAKEQEATVSEQAATIHEMMGTAQSISKSTEKLAQTMNTVSQLSDSTAKSANHGQSSLTRMESTMTRMVEASDSISSKLVVLNEKAGKINTVITTITKVAEQTNLLSLNASIESEKAGEYGAGFAVVAREIRRLADQTEVATWDIEHMVKEMQSAVSASVMGMEKFSQEIKNSVNNVADIGNQLNMVIEQVHQLVPYFEEVNNNMQSQASNAHQITDALEQLNHAEQQTVQSIHMSNQSIHQLHDVAKTLKNGISRFKLKYNGPGNS